MAGAGVLDDYPYLVPHLPGYGVGTDHRYLLRSPLLCGLPEVHQEPAACGLVHSMADMFGSGLIYILQRW